MTILFKAKLSFRKKSKINEKTGTNFVSLSRTSNTIGQFTKTFFCIGKSKFCNLLHAGEFENVNITSKYFIIFNNSPPASWAAHITKGFLTCYSCSYYSFMNTIIKAQIIVSWQDLVYSFSNLLVQTYLCDAIRAYDFLCHYYETWSLLWKYDLITLSKKTLPNSRL